MLAIVVALLPVSALLIVLILFDSFKLVPVNTIIRAALAGIAAALIAWLLHIWLFDVTGLDSRQFSRYVAPVTEELLKAAFVLFALRRAQIGFLVDAAIIGFTIGAGFAVVENLHSLGAAADRHLLIWIVRGFGTAILHATTTAIVAIAAKSMADRYPDREFLVIWPGLIAAIALHSVFNHALVSPLLAAGVLTLVLPLVVLVVFGESERRTREWVGDGLDLDVELLALVKSSHFGATRLGRYLQELKSRFPGPVVADMFCLLQLDLELAIRAKGMLMAREAGLDVPADPDLKARLDERVYLQKTIGPTGRLALRPLQVTSDRDDWHRYLLGQIRQ